MHDIKDLCEPRFPDKWKTSERSKFENAQGCWSKARTKSVVVPLM